jgi:hypothetical protein
VAGCVDARKPERLQRRNGASVGGMQLLVNIVGQNVQPQEATTGATISASLTTRFR